MSEHLPARVLGKTVVALRGHPSAAAPCAVAVRQHRIRRGTRRKAIARTIGCYPSILACCLLGVGCRSGSKPSPEPNVVPMDLPVATGSLSAAPVASGVNSSLPPGLLARSQATLAQRLESVDAFAFSQDGSLVAVAGGVGNSLWVLRANDWSPIGHFPQEGSISAVAFSPDASVLYVAGGGAGLQIHTAVDWRTGQTVRAYNGHTTGLHSLAVSRDGATMVTESFYNEEIILWNTAQTEPVRRWTTPKGCSELALRPDGRVLAWQSGKEELTIEPIAKGGGPRKTVQVGELYRLAFTSDGARLVVAVQGPGGPLLKLVDAGTGTVLATSPPLAGFRVERLAVAPDGTTVAVDGPGAAVRVFDLPTLGRSRDLRLAPGSPIESIQAVGYSPDGKQLIVGDHRTAPFIFRTDTWEEKPVHAGHQDHLEHAAFSSDGASIRTIGRDQTACKWRTADLSLERCLRLPERCDPVSVREVDGQFSLCLPEGTDRVNLGSSPTPTRALVVDNDTGAIVTELSLPLSYSNQFSWPSGSRVLLAVPKRVLVLNAMTGTVERSFDQELNGRVHFDEVANAVFALGGGARYSDVWVERLDLSSGAKSVTPHARLPDFSGNRLGLVPGGELFWVGMPRLFVFQRANAALVSSPAIPDESDVAFDRDGARGAAVISPQTSDGDLVLFATKSGQELLRRKLGKGPRFVRFSPDRKRVLVTYGSGLLELWQADAGLSPGK